jgi:hypothetical protein
MNLDLNELPAYWEFFAISIEFNYYIINVNIEYKNKGNAGVLRRPK